MVRYLYVYILKCSDETLYTGITNSIERRMKEHNSGKYPTSYTFKRRPLELCYCEKFTNFIIAIEFEKKLKKWSAKKKWALIKGDFAALKEEAACKNSSHYRKSPLDYARGGND